MSDYYHLRPALTTGRFAAAALIGIIACVAPAKESKAQTRWITDKVEIDVRRGKSLQHGIVRMVPTGTTVELLEQDREEGYSRIRLPGDAEGWVLSRYLVDEPPPRVALPNALERLAGAEEKRKAAEAAMQELRAERDRLAGQLEVTGSARDEQAKELAEIRRISAGAIDLNETNRNLKEQVATLEQQAAALTEENRRLKSGSTRDWFLAGGATIIVGILLGLLLPRLRVKRRSSWDSF